LTRLFNKGRRSETISWSEVSQAINLAATRKSTQLATDYNLVPSRAETIGTGALIIAAILEHFGLDTATVSRGGIREGVLLTYAHQGENWRNSLF
jgi:exopolyphosphatase/pppGpp-phosphohydrolase